MKDNRKIKEIYGCVSIVSEGELYPLQKWYNQLIEKSSDEITIADVLRMIRQKEFINLAMSKAINLLEHNVFVGESYDGELLEKILQIENSVLICYADNLKNIINKALEESEIYEWSYEGEKEEFKSVIESLARKIM